MVELGLMHKARIQKVRNELTQEKLDSFLVSDFYNVLYLTGFKTLTTDEREAFVLVTKKNIYLFTDERYISKHSNFLSSNDRQTIKLKLIEPNKGLLTHLQEIVEEEILKTIGFEAEDILFLEYQKIKEYVSTVRLIPLERLMIKIRETKDDYEVETIRKACEIGDQCLTEIVSTIKFGQTEKEIAFRIEMWLKGKGYDIAFDPIVAADANSALPHYNTKTGNGRLQDSSVILIDFGVKYRDYLSDITRIFFYSTPSNEVANVYTHLLNAQEKAIEKVSQTKDPNSVDIFCRRMITDQNLPTYPHSTGHGVGLEIHEYPKISFNSRDSIQDGQVFTIEPGVYIDGKFGMRIEDTVAIKQGKAKILTAFSKKIAVIPA